MVRKHRHLNAGSTWIALFVALPLALSLGLSGCARVQDFEVRGFAGLTLELDANASAHSDIEVRIFNPNSISITLTGTDLVIFLEGLPVGRVELPASVELVAGDETAVPLLVIWDRGAVIDAAGHHALSWLINGADVRVQGTASGRAFLLRRTVPIDHEQRIRRSDLMR